MNLNSKTYVGPRSNIQGINLPLVSACNSSRRPILAGCACQVPNTMQPLIVVVDDDASVCRALKRLIGSLGMTVETYVSSREFVDLIEALPSFKPVCVLLDVQMPGMNGLEVQASLRRARGAIPTI